MTQHTHVTPTLSPGLLGQIPHRFFGDLPTAVQELIQNAHRAQARHLTFDLDGDTLRVADDGSGLDDPQLLMSAGQSGWDEHVVNPAGLGALSVLNPDFASSVTYRSGNWQFTLTPDDFAAARPSELQRLDTVQKGFSLSITLKDVTKLNLRHLIEARRGYSPIEVTFQGHVIPPRSIDGQPLETSAGTFWYTRKRDRNITIWEAFEVSGDEFRAALAGRSELLNAFVGSNRFTWMVDPACGVRPKLPDRSRLLDNQALSDAAEVVAAVIERHVTAVYSELIDLKADLLTSQALEEARKTFGNRVLEAFLDQAGFVSTSLSKPHGIWTAVSDDSSECGGWSDDYVHPGRLSVIRAEENAQAKALNYLHTLKIIPQLGSADHSDLSIPLELTCGDVQTLETPVGCGALTFGLTPALSVNGVSVPFAVGIETQTETYQLVLSGTPQQAETFLRAHQAALGGLALYRLIDSDDLNFSDLADDNTEEDETISLNAQQVGEALLGSLIRSCFPDRAAAQAQRDVAQQASELMGELCRTIAELQKLRSDPHYDAWLDVLTQQMSQENALTQALTLEHQLD